MTTQFSLYEILGLNHVFRGLKTCQNGLIFEDDVGNSKLAIFVKKDLKLQDLVKMLTVHMIEVRSGEIFIYCK